MPALPHNFPSLRQCENGARRRPVLLMGAGMSYDLAPSPGELFRDKRTEVEAALGYISAVVRNSPPNAEDLYEWAEDILHEISRRGDRNPKLSLAKTLGMLDDPRWLGARRNSPCHRVIARFAREKLWDEIWSLNWDCIQESALENVGVARDGRDEGLDWPTRFSTFVTAQDCRSMGPTSTVRVIKPHGCVVSLQRADAIEDLDPREAAALCERFLIKKTELASAVPAPSHDDTQEFIFARLLVKLCTQPLVAAGWSASEKYLVDHIVGCVRVPQPVAEDEICIIAPTFRSKGQDGHQRLADHYGRSASSVHIPIERKDGFTRDQLFLWLESLYAVQQLEFWTESSADRSGLSDLAAEIERPPDSPHFIYSWADNFLPAWTRLCWRCDLVSYYRHGHRLSADDIPMETRDAHIPWNIPGIDRPDMKAAARLLAALQRTANGVGWDYEQYSGGLLKDNDLLVIPLPAWGGSPQNDLAGLKPLVDAMKGKGEFFERVEVLFLAPDPAENVPEGRRSSLKELLARALCLARVPNGAAILEHKLEDL